MDSALQGRLEKATAILRPTPVVALRDDRVDLWAKLEYCNGIGSIKDRPALWILKRAIERGEIDPLTTVIESSSGNFACALAVFCKLLKLNFIPVIDANISPVYEATLRSLCAGVERVDECDDTGGYLKTRLHKVKALCETIDHSYWPNQYANPDGMHAHYELTGTEIVHAKLSFDYIFIGVGSAGTIAGVSRRVKEDDPRLKVIAVDAVGSVIFGQTPRRRWIPGLGSSISPPLVESALIDDVVFVSEPDSVAGCQTLLTRHGIFAGGSTGTVYSAIQQYFSGFRGARRPRVLFLCSDRGTAYLHNVYDARWAAWRASVSDKPLERQMSHG